MRRSSAALGLLAGLLVTGAVTGSPASAGTAALGSGTPAVGSVAWAVTPTTLDTMTPLPGPATLTFGSCVLLALCPAPQYFWFVNTGSVTLTGATYAFSSTGVGLGSFTVTACVNGSWVSGSCTGTTATLTSGATTVVPAAAGTRLQVQVKVAAVLSVATVVTVAATVSSATPRQIRPAASTTS